METAASCALLPTYSYARLYLQGDSLPRHRDRPACEIAATIHLALLGKNGLAQLARLNLDRAALLADAMKRAGCPRVFSGPTFNEAVYDVGDAEAVVARLAKRGIVAGAPLARWYPDLPKAKGALLCVATELHSPELIELFAKSVRG